jgi:TDG/mug DNA glycosylase family protein
MPGTTRVHSFPPLAGPGARVLVLGSMPGVASLQAQQYYAHPRNLFWPIMGELFGAGPDKTYEERGRILTARGVAVWDVLQSCVRPGSLDSSISAEVPNDFAAFFAAQPGIAHIFTNGGKADVSLRRSVPDLPDGVVITRLPSTSPAHAALGFAEKCRIWAAVKDAAG